MGPKSGDCFEIVSGTFFFDNSDSYKQGVEHWIRVAEITKTTEIQGTNHGLPKPQF